jgi:hypothetical protein
VRTLGLGLVAIAMAIGAAGCGILDQTISHSGTVGQTLTGPQGLKIQPSGYHPQISAGHDVSGLATPAPGTHFASFLINICISSSGLPTISEQNFHLDLDGGGEAPLKFPQTRLSDLNLLGEAGCERGHIVFQVPTGGTPTALRFTLDVDRNDAQGSEDITKVRLKWALPVS